MRTPLASVASDHLPLVVRLRVPVQEEGKASLAERDGA